jgi:hypothetical protein
LSTEATKGVAATSTTKYPKEFPSLITHFKDMARESEIEKGKVIGKMSVPNLSYRLDEDPGSRLRGVQRFSCFDGSTSSLL